MSRFAVPSAAAQAVSDNGCRCGLPPCVVCDFSVAARTSDLSDEPHEEPCHDGAAHGGQARLRLRPVLAVLEDAHWANPTTRELLDMLVAAAPGLRMLLVITHRPEFQPPWAGEANVTVLCVKRLGRREAAALVGGVEGGAVGGGGCTKCAATHETRFAPSRHTPETA